MFTVNPQEAQAVETHIERIFESPSVQTRAEAVGRLFVEELDFHPIAKPLPLANARSGVTLPSDAHQVASLDNTHVVYVALDLPDSDRVRKAEASEAARLISRELGDDLLSSRHQLVMQPTSPYISIIRGQASNPAAYGRRA